MGAAVGKQIPHNISRTVLWLYSISQNAVIHARVACPAERFTFQENAGPEIVVVCM